MLVGQARLQLIQAEKISLRSTTIDRRNAVAGFSTTNDSLKLEFARDRPRKTLDYETPANRFATCVASTV
jgi:hypothetical protein